MKIEAQLFLYGILFFVPVGLIYGFWSGGEPVGTVSIPLTGGLVGMIGGYFALLARRVGQRPEDDELGEIEQGAGNQGTFSPWSWWPLVVGLAASIAFLALAVGWWLMVPAVALAAIGLVGWLFEFSRGQHAH